MPCSTPGLPDSITTAKAQARRLKQALEGQMNLKHGQALELIAKLHAQESWGHLHSMLDGAPPPAIVDMHPAAVSWSGQVLAERTTVAALMSETDHLSQKYHDSPLPDMHRGYLCTILRYCAGSQDCEWVGDTSQIPDEVLRSYLFSVTDKDLIDATQRAKVLGRFDSNKMADHVLEATIKILKGRDQPSMLAPGAWERLIKRVQAPYDDHKPQPVLNINRRALFDGLHSMVVGEDITPLLTAYPEIVDLCRSDAIDPGGLAPFHGTAYPKPGFSSQTVAMMFLSGIKMSMVINNLSSSPRRKDRVPVLLRVSDMVASPSVDVLMAQARSLGIHILVHLDRFVKDDRVFKSIQNHTSGLIKVNHEGQMTIRSPNLQEEVQIHKMSLARRLLRL
jgi:hypothetical protein